MKEKKMVKNRLYWGIFGLFVLFLTVLVVPKDVYAGTKNLTLTVGQEKTVFPRQDDWDYKDRVVQSGAWCSYGEEYVEILSDPSDEVYCKMRAKKATSSPIIVQLYYSYRLYSTDTHWYLAHSYVDYKITVEYAEAESVSLSRTYLTMKAGESAQLRATVYPEGADQTCSYRSSNSSVAQVSSSGKVTAKGAGTATITAETVNGKTTTCAVTVKADNTPTGITLSAASLNLQGIGTERQLTYTLTPSGATADVTFTSSDTSVATVGRSSGLVTAVGSGTATITASTTQGLRATCTVTVETVPDKPVSEFTYHVLADGTLELTEYNGTLENITIPDMVAETKVSAIGDNVFSDCSSLKSVKLPEGLIRIGECAFAKCNNLKNIELPEGLTNIGYRAFWCCSNLESIKLPGSLKSTGEQTFLRCSGLKNVELSEGLTNIGDYAFQYCSSLGSIKLPKSLTSINTYAFSICDNLKNVELPEGLTSIGEHAFWKCVSLESIKLPEGLESISDAVFRECSSLETIELSEGLANIGMSAFRDCSSLETIELPGSLTKINNCAFLGCSNLKSIQLPEGLTNIGDYAFQECSSLESIKLPRSLTSINAYAFSICDNLKNVELPEGLTGIGEDAFWKCGSLENIKLPQSVSFIGKSAFESCGNLKEVSYAGASSQWQEVTIEEHNECLTNATFHFGVEDSNPKALDFTYNVLDDGTLTITGYNGTAADVTVPAAIDGKQVTRIGAGAFNNDSGLRSVTLPNGITWIYTWAFSSDSLINVNLPESVFHIDEWAFSGKNITNINVSKGNKTYSSYDGCLYTKDGSELLFCPYGKNSVSLKTNLKRINGNAFADCSNLVSISLPGGVSMIGSGAFSGCISLKRIDIPISVAYINNDAFSSCFSLKDIYYAGSSSQWKGINIGEGNESLTNATLHCTNAGIKPTNPNPSPVGAAHKKGTVLKYGGNIYVVTKVKSEVAFKEPSGSKTSITIPNTVKIDGITYKVTSISDYAFFEETGTNKLKKVVIGDNVKSIGYGAFMFCEKLSSVKMGKKVKEIGESAFYGCKGLKSITIPKGVTKIDRAAFMDCKGLKSIIIPKGVTKIGSCIFSGCESLKSITIPKGVTQIGDDAFSGCKSLKSIIIPKGVTNIGFWAFEDCKNIKSITIPKNVKKIGEEAFRGCPKLKTITIKSTKLTSVGRNAFKGINSKAKIKVPSKKLKAYKRLLKGKGQGKKVKVIK